MLDVPLAQADTLVERLLGMAPLELERRQRYAHHAASWLLFDRNDGQPGAADAALWEIEQRILGPNLSRPKHIPQALPR